MSVRAAALLVVAWLAATGCVAHVHAPSAQAIDPAALAADDGWTFAPTPAIRQQAAVDCGAAAIAMVLTRWDQPTTLADATRALPPPNATGVSLGALREVAIGRGLRAFAVPGELALLRHELEAGRPVIVGLLRPVSGGGLKHFEVVVAIDAEDRIATIDPADGWLVRPWLGFDGEWQAVGRPALVVLGPSPSAGRSP